MFQEEKNRLKEREKWLKWGPYVAERAWGTVREDYSVDGKAWQYLTHDRARSTAYRWSEDGLAGFCDEDQRLVFSLALWNEKDPILKERLFGLNPDEGNHGEDVKELYFYLDSTPTHSYMKFLYKYPQVEFPYSQLIAENQKRGLEEREFELLDTGIFSEGKYFDVVVEYAKQTPEDIFIRVQVYNRGKEAAPFHLLPQLTLRNQWSWTGGKRSQISDISLDKEAICLFTEPTYFYGPSGGVSLFTHNETNREKLYGVKNETPFVKDAFHRYIIQKEASVNPQKIGTKAAIHYSTVIAAGGCQEYLFRLTDTPQTKPLDKGGDILKKRLKEADVFYNNLQNKGASEEDRQIQRQALAGMLWSKQFYHYDVELWLKGDPAFSPPKRVSKRNSRWSGLQAKSVISMPDKWEYPWFAAWDLSFHTIALSLVDPVFAKEQLRLLLKSYYQNSSGQIPAYEWNFSDLNPPVQAWAAWYLYCCEGKTDRDFLEDVFIKLLFNFSWWINKIDWKGNNLFEGGFLGLDNISIIDRSDPLPDGSFFEESDGTGWMGFFSLVMLQMSLELAKGGHTAFERIALTFLAQFSEIAAVIRKGLWDETDGFFYDKICTQDGQKGERLNIRSFVGIIPFYAFDFLNADEIAQFPLFSRELNRLLENKNGEECPVECFSYNHVKKYCFSLISAKRAFRLLEKVWDRDEFLSPYGVRSLSKIYEKQPFSCRGRIISYEPGESKEKIKGGNSNWRGPIWFPTNFLLLEALKKRQEAFEGVRLVKTKEGDRTFKELKEDLEQRLIKLFRKTEKGNRPVHGETQLFEKEWNDLILFYEHYHAETGRGLGASHQTGWSGLIAVILRMV